MTWTVDELPRMDDERVVVTGANSGLGYEATEALAGAGATVVMACRSVDRAERAADEVRATVPGADLTVVECDLGDLSAVADAAATIREGGSVDVLCNNAGVMAIPRQETVDGFEAQFGVNHLGHFALTGALLPALAGGEATESRVVTQTSGAHETGRIDFDDLQSETSYGKWRAYAQSKLANVLFAYELDRRVGAAGLPVTSVACHPGYADTELQANMARERGSRLLGALVRVANGVLAQSAERGALPMLYAAAAPDVEGGTYYGPDGLLNARGYPEQQESSDRSYDEETAARLWRVSAELTGVTYDFERARAVV